MISAMEYCKNVFDGTHDSPKPSAAGFKLLTSKHILNNKLDKENAYFISKNDYDSINKRSKVRKWDILFSMIGTVGNIYLVTEDNIDFAIKNMGVFSCEDEYEAKWLYYYLKSPYAQSYIKNYLNGAIQKFLPLNKLRDFPVPKFEENSKKIVDILWALDEKIKNNKIINSQLESLLKIIYNYWFLQFEFPDENGKPYKSSGGEMVWNDELKKEIPEGWEVKKISEILSKIPSTENIKKNEYKSDGAIPIIDQSTEYICGYTNKKETIVNLKDSIIFGDHTKIIKYINFNFARGADGTQILNSNNSNLSNYLLYQQIKDFDLISQGYSRYFKFLKDKYIIIPEQKTNSDYSKLTVPINETIKNNVIENKQLMNLRDFLLPLLMNGQIGFKD